MSRLHGKVALITGGARGIGRATANRFAEEGARIVLVDFVGDLGSVPYQMAGQSELAKAVEEVKGLGADALGFPADVRDFAALSSAVEQSIDHFGAIDVVVCSAGVLSYGLAWELEEQTWDETMDVNVKGVWLSCKAVVPHMISRRRGKIICISSVNGFRGGKTVSHYVASKHAVIGFVKSLAMEVGPYGIHVSAICPTAVDTPMANNSATYDRLAGKKGAKKEEATPAFSRHHVFPDQGFIDPKDVANVALFLASDESTNITGHHIAVDAGYLAV